MRMANLNEKRTFFHLSAIDENLYAVGGRNAAGELATVEKYYAKENQVNFRSAVFIKLFKTFFSGNLFAKCESLTMATLAQCTMEKCTFLVELLMTPFKKNFYAMIRLSIRGNSGLL